MYRQVYFPGALAHGNNGGLHLTQNGEKATWLAEIVHRTGLNKDLGPIMVFLAASLAAGLLVNTLFPVKCPAVSPLPGQAQVHQPSPDEAYVSPTCAEALVKYADAVLIDVRGALPYSTSHAAGAINIPAPQVFEQSNLQRLSELQADRPIIFYCEAHCTSSHSIAKKLRRQGWENVLAMNDGIELWQEKGLPTETGVRNEHRATQQ